MATQFLGGHDCFIPQFISRNDIVVLKSSFHQVSNARLNRGKTRL
jgi:hypothetical protein